MNANANANVESGLFHVLIGANANQNPIELTKNADVLLEIGSKKDIYPFRFITPHIGNLSLPIGANVTVNAIDIITKSFDMGAKMTSSIRIPCKMEFYL